MSNSNYTDPPLPASNVQIVYTFPKELEESFKKHFPFVQCFPTTPKTIVKAVLYGNEVDDCREDLEIWFQENEHPYKLTVDALDILHTYYSVFDPDTKQYSYHSFDSYAETLGLLHRVRAYLRKGQTDLALTAIENHEPISHKSELDPFQDESLGVWRACHLLWSI